MASYAQLAKRLQSAINDKIEGKILIKTDQWFSEDKGRPITCYTIKKSDVYNARSTTELFRTYSQIQMVLFLRDYWYEINGWEVPQDNIVWEEVKRIYVGNKRPSDVDPVIRKTGSAN